MALGVADQKFKGFGQVKPDYRPNGRSESLLFHVFASTGHNACLQLAIKGKETVKYSVRFFLC
jgi:hypothetical protein